MGEEHSGVNQVLAGASATAAPPIYTRPFTVKAEEDPGHMKGQYLYALSRWSGSPGPVIALGKYSGPITPVAGQLHKGTAFKRLRLKFICHRGFWLDSFDESRCRDSDRPENQFTLDFALKLLGNLPKQLF